MKDSRVCLIHIQDCIRRVESYTKEGKETFLADEKTQDAVIHNLEVMCESTRNLRSEWKSAHPEIDWIRARDFRNFLAHQYLDIDLAVVWNVIENYVPALKTAVVEIAKTVDI